LQKDTQSIGFFLMADQWIVVGGGFRGIIGAYLLAQQGQKVVLIERGRALGGVLNSIPWKGFYLDKGCHLFANEDNLTTRIVMTILEDEFEPVHVRYASVMGGLKTDGIAIPNLGSFGQQVAQTILYEVVEASAEAEQASQNLKRQLEQRFGVTAAGYLARAAYKMYRIESTEIEADALRMTPFRRIKFLDDALANILKQSPSLDARVAASSQNDPMRFYRHQAQEYSFKNFYPKEKGLHRFCEKAEEKLRELGVTILTDTKVEQLTVNTQRARSHSHVTLRLSTGLELVGKRVLWALGLDVLEQLFGWGRQIAAHIHQVPMVLYYFVIEKDAEGPYTYLQNFSQENRFFRASIPGGYISDSACPDGYSYVCCEVPLSIGSAEWENPKHFAIPVWQELQKYEVVRSHQPIDMLSVTVPSTYKLPKVGYQQAVKQVTERLAHYPQIVGAEAWEFSKNDIIRSLQRALGLPLSHKLNVQV
jgi:protoporphyrinogen oxidase